MSGTTNMPPRYRKTATPPQLRSDEAGGFSLTQPERTLWLRADFVFAHCPWMRDHLARLYAHCGGKGHGILTRALGESPDAQPLFTRRVNVTHRHD
jgi:hypothetical protein